MNLVTFLSHLIPLYTVTHYITESAMESVTSATDRPASPFGEGLSYELVSKGKLQAYHIHQPGPQADAIYYIETHETLSRNKFDLLLHRGDSKDGEVLGVVKMHTRGFTIGIGNPADELEGSPITWEKLERPEKYSHKIYHFDFGTGERRTTYTYRKTNGRTGRLKSMELRTGGIDKEDGQLLAKWLGSSSWHMKDGSLFIARSGQDQNAPRGGEANEWEIMVCLTTFAIIESQHRRSKG